MSKEEFISFLKKNQPLPSDLVAADELFEEFERARIYFTQQIEPSAVPLLIGALGEGDGHGIYPMVETTLCTYPSDVVIAALRNGLRSEYPSVRYWSAQFSASYPVNELLDELIFAFHQGNDDTRIAVVTALEIIGTEKAFEYLRLFQSEGQADPVSSLIEEVLGSQ